MIGRSSTRCALENFTFPLLSTNDTGFLVLADHFLRTKPSQPTSNEASETINRVNSPVTPQANDSMPIILTSNTD